MFLRKYYKTILRSSIDNTCACYIIPSSLTVIVLAGPTS